MLFEAPLFHDRTDAGHRLGALLLARGPYELPLALGLARGGVAVAAEVAQALGAPLDVIAVRKIGHPLQPEYAIGAVAPGGAVYVRGPDGLRPSQVDAAVEDASRRADELDAELHAGRAPLDPEGATAIAIDDGLATGATMIAACRWARSHGAATVVAAAPVVASACLALVRPEADEVVALAEQDPFVAVALWYAEFGAVSTDDVLRLLEARRPDAEPGVRAPGRDARAPRPRSGGRARG
ncbi:MAG TPA: phosphoribosyltransferase family protein [Gaiellaceae bacterium]|nr:phosphoribosyltransferase family protein [Gaiellaceae bacterium]